MPAKRLMNKSAGIAPAGFAGAVDPGDDPDDEPPSSGTTRAGVQEENPCFQTRSVGCNCPAAMRPFKTDNASGPSRWPSGLATYHTAASDSPPEAALEFGGPGMLDI